VGMLLSIFAVTLLAPWGVAIAAQTRPSEKGFPVLSDTQIACVAGGMALFVLDILVWAVASFRPDDVAPETTRMLNDFGWFLFLFAIPPFCVWIMAIALAILLDRGDAPA